MVQLRLIVMNVCTLVLFILSVSKLRRFSHPLKDETSYSCIVLYLFICFLLWTKVAGKGGVLELVYTTTVGFRHYYIIVIELVGSVSRDRLTTP